MKVVYTDQSLQSLEDTIQFLLDEQGLSILQVQVLISKLLNKADSLELNPSLGQKEVYLEHLNRDHRRLVEDNVKIIYRVEGDNIYITDFFDTRQDPSKMKVYDEYQH